MVLGSLLNAGRRRSLFSEQPKQKGEKKAYEDASDEREIESEVAS